MDIDKYYQDEKNQKKLKEINNSDFGKMFCDEEDRDFVQDSHDKTSSK